MLSIEELLKRHGYSIMSSGTEYTINVLDSMRDSLTSIESYKDFYRVYRSIVDRVSRERPACAQATNVLRDIGLLIVDGVENKLSIRDICSSVSERIGYWKDRIVRDCEEAAHIASHRLVDGDVVLTHSRSLCVLKAIKKARDDGKKLEFYVTESRPGMEGLVTASEISKLGYPVKLVIDSAVRFFMKDVDKVLVGAEAVAVNGAVVSKVGTSLISLIAHEARVRVFVIAPISKFNLETLFGELVELPESDWRKLMSPDILAKLPENYLARVPLYDVTPPSYIDGIATEKGLFAPQAIPVILKDVYGSWPPAVIDLDELVYKLYELTKGV